MKCKLMKWKLMNHWCVGRVWWTNSRCDIYEISFRTKLECMYCNHMLVLVPTVTQRMYSIYIDWHIDSLLYLYQRPPGRCIQYIDWHIGSLLCNKSRRSPSRHIDCHCTFTNLAHIAGGTTNVTYIWCNIKTNLACIPGATTIDVHSATSIGWHIFPLLYL